MNTLFLIELRQRELIRQLCRETIDLALRRTEEGMLIPDDELEAESENLYETLRSDLAGMLKPEFLGMLAEEHDAVYRSSAGQRLKRMLGWEEEEACGETQLQPECA
jgi:hypothetical protein